MQEEKVKICKQCLKQFVYIRKNTIFCSKKCADKNYCERTKDNKREYDRLRHLENSEAINIRVTNWRNNHKDERYSKEKIKLENSFSKRFYKNALTMIKSHFRNFRKSKRSNIIQALGYSFEQLKQHLLTTIPEGFSWLDYLKGILHIDHIKQHSKFKYDDIQSEQFKKCWSLNNLRLLEAYKNIRQQS